MSILYRLGVLLIAAAFASGCANQNIKPTTVICPILGATAGVGLVAGGLDSTDAAALAGGAIVGAGLAYFLCQDRTEPPKPQPAPAPAPAPRPAPPPPPPPPPPPAPEVGTQIETLEGAMFDFDKATLRPTAVAKLDRSIQIMNEHPTIRVSIEGHTDSVGSDSYNQGLSERRAQAVLDYLVGNGIAASRLSATGYGESRPITDNNSEESRARNRRVELIVAE